MKLPPTRHIGREAGEKGISHQLSRNAHWEFVEVTNMKTQTAKAILRLSIALGAKIGCWVKFAHHRDLSNGREMHPDEECEGYLHR